MPHAVKCKWGWTEWRKCWLYKTNTQSNYLQNILYQELWNRM